MNNLFRFSVFQNGIFPRISRYLGILFGVFCGGIIYKLSNKLKDIRDILTCWWIPLTNRFVPRDFISLKRGPSSNIIFINVKNIIWRTQPNSAISNLFCVYATNIIEVVNALHSGFSSAVIWCSLEGGVEVEVVVVVVVGWGGVVVVGGGR